MVFVESEHLLSTPTVGLLRGMIVHEYNYTQMYMNIDNGGLLLLTVPFNI